MENNDLRFDSNRLSVLTIPEIPELSIIKLNEPGLVLNYDHFPRIGEFLKLF